MKPLRPGDRAPDPSVLINGQVTRLSEHRGDQALVLSFLRHLQ